MKYTEYLNQIEEAHSREDMLASLVELASNLDFERVGWQEYRGGIFDRWETNAPAEYLSNGSDKALAVRDPISIHVKSNPKPLFWGLENYQKANAMDLWDAQSAFGFKSGIQCSARMGDLYISLGFSVGARLPSADHTRTFAQGLIQTAAVYLAVKLSNEEFTANPVSIVELSTRQREVVSLRARGLLIKQISEELNISVDAVNASIATAKKKLGVKGTGLVARAIELRLL